MEAPRDLRLIPLKYAGRCRSCGTRLDVGERAHWSPSSKSVWCMDCAGDGISSQAAPESGSGGLRTARRPTGKSGLDVPKDGSSNEPTPWQQLCIYVERCIEAEAANTLIPYARANSLWFLHCGEEQLIVGQGDTTSASPELAARLTPRTRSIIYGWPTVVVTDRDHAPTVAPLFAVLTEPERRPDSQWELRATMEPELNLAITASGIFDPAVAEDVGDLLSDGLPFGDADALAALAARTAALLRLPILSPLNASALESQVGRQTGVYNAAVSVFAEWSGYTGALRAELRQLRTRTDWSTTAAAHLLPSGFAGTEGSRRRTGPLAAPLPSNQSQEETLERFRGEPLTVVTGPPGTGKTQLVVNAVANAWLDGDKVLVSSTNNRAVDVAVERAVGEVSSGLLVRTGKRDMRERVPDRIGAALHDAAAHRGSQAAARAVLRQAADERSGLLKRLARLDELDLELMRLVAKQEELLSALEEAARTLWAGATPPELPLGSDAIHRRTRRLLRAWLFRGFRTRRLRRKLGCAQTAPLEQLVTWALIDQRIAKLTSKLKSRRDERRRLGLEVGDPSTRVREADRRWADASLDAIRAETATRIATGRERLGAFGTTPANTERFKKTVGTSFRYLRGWACTALTAQSNFPLESGLFDLVIVDEASQCSLAAVLPLAYRAKRLAVVGDPHQLNPIVCLGDGLLQGIAMRAGFDNNDLRDRGMHHKAGSAYSAFEFAARPQTPVLLDEHYRCHPRIARWFNKTFYGGELTVLTDVSDGSELDRAVCWCDIDGTAERPANGSWRNWAEGEEAVKQIRTLVEAGYGSIGVVSPFTAQARLIDGMAKARFGEDALDDLDFVSGTAHRLQGDERDAVIISCVLAPGVSKSGARWIEKERNLLNVAVSRARRALIVLGHPRIGELGSPTLSSLRVYLSEATRKENTASPYATFRTDSNAEQLLLEAMQHHDLVPYAKLDVAGYELDFALLQQGIRLNIEVDGDQHLDARGRQRRQDLARDRVLQNLGWTILRVPAWQCHEEIDSVIADVRNERDRLFEQAATGA